MSPWKGPKLDARTKTLLESSQYIEKSASAEIDVPHLMLFAVGEGGVWLLAPKESAVIRLDPQTTRAVATIPVGGVPIKIVVGEGAVWVMTLPGTVVRIDPQSNQVVAQIPVGDLELGYSWYDKTVARRYFPVGSFECLAAGEGAVWVFKANLKTLLRIDATSNRVVATIPVIDGFPGLAVSEGFVWVVGTSRTRAAITTLVRVDPKTNQAVGSTEISRRVSVYSAPTAALAAGEGSLWFGSASRDGTAFVVLRFDPKRNEIIERIPLWCLDREGGIAQIVVGGGSVWFSQLSPVPSKHKSIISWLARIDPHTNRQMERFARKFELQEGWPGIFLAVGEGALWVARDHKIWKYDLEKSLGGVPAE